MPRRILMPPRFVVEGHDSSIWDGCREEMFIGKPVDLELFVAVLYFSDPCPGRIRTETMNCDDTRRELLSHESY